MNKLQRPDTDMDWPLVEKIASDFAANGMVVSWLHEMGEPTLYSRLAEAVDLFPGCSVSTNAVRLDEEMGRDLLASSLWRLRLCIDTLNPEVYPIIRRGGSFAKVVNNIRRFLELSQGSSMRVEIQKMITLQTSAETLTEFEDFFEIKKYPQASIIEKTCEGLDTTDETDLHESFYGCFQGYPFRWFIVLADGTVTHCCYDANGLQPIGDMNEQTVEEILASETISTYMNAFKKKDWQALPRCGECYSNATGTKVVVDQLQQLGHKLDRVAPIKKIARKIINR